MVDLLDNLEVHFQGQYEICRSEVQYGKRLTIRHMENVVNVDLFQTGKAHVSGKNSTLKEEVGKLVEGFRKDPHFFEKRAEGAAEVRALTPEEVVLQHVTKELFDFLPPHDQRALLASCQVLLSDLNLVDYSPVIMPVGRAYEGFLGELVIRLAAGSGRCEF
jgi:hypothetical protein